MTIDSMLTNVAMFLTALLLPIGGIAAVLCVVLFVIGKTSGSIRTIDHAKNAFWGAVVGFGGVAIIAIVKNAATRITGGGA